MKKIGIIVLALVIGSSSLLTACSRTSRDDANVKEMENGQVVEMEGAQDQYGWLPHLRLTFDGETLKEVYFDYVNDEAAKKSQDEEYNSTMQEKTGMSAKDAMEKLRANLIETQDPAKVDIVAGASQTSTEFIELAKQGFEKYFKGKTSANNYGEDNSDLGKVDTTKEAKGQETKGNTQTQSTGSSTGESGPTSPYTTGGDGNPNNQKSGNEAGGGGNTTKG